jgi:hypothetical protein
MASFSLIAGDGEKEPARRLLEIPFFRRQRTGLLLADEGYAGCVCMRGNQSRKRKSRQCLEKENGKMGD